MIEHYILDTNIILAEKKNLRKLIENLKLNNHLMFTTEVSIQELKGQVSRDIQQGVSSIEKVLKSSIGQYFNSGSNYDINEAIKKSRAKIDASMEKIFQTNIIPLNADNYKIKTIFDRASDRKAPFSNKENSSDKGFKDTLLWLSIIDYYKGKSDIKVNLISNDNIFQTFMSELKEEFKLETTLEIEIKNGSSISITKMDNFVDNELEGLQEISIDLKVLEDIINDFLFSDEFDAFGNKDVKRNFNIHKHMENEDVKNFLEYLKVMLKTKYSLFRTINLFNVFNTIGIKTTVSIEIESPKCKQLINMYEIIKKEGDVFFDSFIELLKEKFNASFEFDPSELPF